MTKPTKLLATLAVVIAVVLLLIFARRPAPAPAPAPAQPEPEVHVETTTLPDFIEQARIKAKTWREDAQLFRLYATEVQADGTFDQNTSDIQLLFTSADANQAAERNGWRMSLLKGQISMAVIWLRPAPQTPIRSAPLCPLPPILGQGAPNRFNLDIVYGVQEDRPPVLQAFTVAPLRWLVLGDPFSCQPIGDSNP